MFEALSIVSALMVFTTIAPHLPGKHWMIRVWEFPRVQQMVVMIVSVIAWGAYFYYTADMTAIGFMLVLLTCIAYQGIWVFPYTIFGPKEVSRIKSPSSEKQFSILTSNVYMHNTNYQGLIDQVKKHKPDMLVTLESNKDWEEALQSIHDDYPHRIPCALENLYGMHLYSKLPFKEKALRYIVEDDVPSMQVTVEIGGSDVIIYFLHPKPPSPTENETAGPRDEELTLVGQDVVDQRLPVIVAGDLNDVAWSPTTRKFRNLSKARDPRRGRGFFNTFHAKYPLIRWPLDHVFHTDHFDLVKIKRLEGYGSDHFPLLTILHLTREGDPCPSSSAPEAEEKASPEA
ncbi:endonuclease/exonuclease/phosphatase family protein [Salinimonas chungwhensis]|uniref:endonuclease/exonuclease/phosphatase family protein n=1 Tax=Salinimonas chungwhensis TaxID=265425 RepID=UPI00036E50A7|nr:endonuclease/exonuclease/phosphatase family protein [Salinimonas chungwhensis]